MIDGDQDDSLIEANNTYTKIIKVLFAYPAKEGVVQTKISSFEFYYNKYAITFVKVQYMQCKKNS